MTSSDVALLAAVVCVLFASITVWASGWFLGKAAGRKEIVDHLRKRVEGE